MAESLADSLHTSIHARLAAMQGQTFVPVLAPAVAIDAMDGDYLPV